MWYKNPARIRCIQCYPAIFMCTDCDNRVHMQMPFHNWEAWVSTHFTPILPTCTLNDSEDSTFKTIRMYIQFYDISITYVHVHGTGMAFMDTSKMSRMSRSWKFKKTIVTKEKHIVIICNGMNICVSEMFMSCCFRKI